MDTNGDRRIQRTRHLLRTALLELVKEKGFESLSVQEIAHRANVGRTTFYAHFDDKEELLLAGFDDLHEQLHRRHGGAGARSPDRCTQPFAFSRTLFEHVEAYREVFQSLAGKRSGEAVLVRLKSLLVELVRGEVKQSLQSRPIEDERREVLVHFIAGALFSLLGWWMIERPSLTPREIDSTFSQLARSALRTHQIPDPGD
jgi:AcrR family transcriptional regulator